MPNWTRAEGKTETVGVLLFERFSNHCLANVIEPLRAANDLARKALYRWRFLTLDGEPVSSSSGLLVQPDGALRDEPAGDALFVLPSYGFRALATPACRRALRAASSRFTVMAGMDTGSWLLAEAGLLNGRRATIHFEEFDGFAERFPELDARRDRFVLDGDRVTCSGAMAAFDLMSELIARRHGEALRLEVEWLFMHAGKMPAEADLPPLADDAIVRRALAWMQNHLEEPRPIQTIADQLGLTQRGLQQRFRSELGTSPQRAYRHLRLLTARKLVDETRLSIGEIAVRCGYADPSAMTRAFTAEFGYSPRVMRQQPTAR